VENLILLRTLYGNYPSFLENSQKDWPETIPSEICENHSLYDELYDFVILVLMKQLYIWKSICSVYCYMGGKAWYRISMLLCKSFLLFPHYLI